MYHPALGFVAGFVSLIVGFSAPIAGSALIIGGYIGEMANVGPDALVWVKRLIAAVVVVLLTLMHARDVRKGAATQNVFTIMKIALIVLFILAGLVFAPETRSFSLSIGTLPSGIWAAFALNLVLVYFAYSGWNAAAYITGEMDNPQRNLPRALMLGTGLVTVLYLLLNYTFLNVVSPAEIAGNWEFGALVADRIFGAQFGWILAGLVAFALVSSTSGNIMAGPRVTAAMGEDFPIFGKLARKNKGGSPAMALGLQLLVAMCIILYGDVLVIFQYIGFTLSIFAFLTVLGLIVNRIKRGKPTTGYTTPLFPLTPILFLLMVGWLIVSTFIGDQAHEAAFAGSLTLAVGLLLYFFVAAPSARKGTKL
jgi:basic amino acid/polyamine antiporter, APA family